jgi:uncharacterized membrane protein YphA (DoxX/SURF4 family)
MWFGLELFMRLVVGGLLTAAGFSKASTSPDRRRALIGAYRLVPGRLLPLVAWLVPAVELVAGAAVLLGAFGRGAAVAADLTLLPVTGAVTWGLVQGLEISCGCFGRLEELISWRIVARNLVLVSAAAAVAVHGVTGPGTGSLPPWAQAMSVAAVATILWALARHRRADRDADGVEAAPSDDLTNTRPTRPTPQEAQP